MSNSFARTSLLIKERLDTDLPPEVKSPTNHQTQLLKIIPTSPGVLKRRENSSPFLTLLNPVRSPQHTNNFSRYTPSDLTKAIDMSYERLGAQTPAVLNSNAPIQFPLAKSGSSSFAKISHISKNSLPESLILNRVNPIEAQAKLRSRLGNSRIEAIEANPGQEKKNRGEKRVANSAMSPRTVVGTYYNYHSQHLTFIPEKLDSSSLNKSSFLGFNDLARTTNSTHQSMLGSLVLEETAMNRVEGGIDPEKKIKALKKVLEFNKLQKEVYDTEIRRQRKEIILPLVKTEQDKQHKQKQMRHIKVLPSQNFYYQMNRIESMQQKSIITDAMNASMVTQSHHKDKSKNDSNDGSEPNLPAKPLYIYKFFWYFAEEERKFWVPEAREGHTLTTVGKNIVLYGGCSNSTKSEIAIYQPGKNIWKQIPTKGESPMHGRHGHTACEFKDCMIVFGGEERLGIDLQFKEYLCDARAFYPEKGEWRYLVCTGKAIDPRRNHAAAIHASTMYVYGGVTYRGEHLDDVWALNLKNYTWTQVSEESTNRHGIAYHTMCACFIEKNVGFIHKAKGAIKEFEDGFYVFGGKDEQGKCLNTLKYFDPSDKPIEWKYPATKGTPPSARFNHTMLFYQPLALLVIYGGKNHLYEDNDKFMELNDIRVLNLETMTWNPTASFGHAPKIPRTNHAATLLGHAMIIFGGIGGNEYMPVQTRVVELNQISVAKLIDRQAQSQDSTNPEPQTLSPDASPTFNSSPTLYKGEKKKVTVSFLPPPQQDAGGEDKNTKQNGVLKGVLKGALKGAVTKVRIMETWKKMRASLKNAAEADA